MDFEFNKEQLDIQKAAQDFAQKEFDRQLAIEYELGHSYPFELRKKACELGFIGVNYPEEYGGQGYGITEVALIREAFCRQDSGFGLCLGASVLGADLILEYGTEEQKKKYIPPLTKGEYICGLGITEPDKGSNVTRIHTQATSDEQGYLINGSKTYITNGSIADFVIVLCQTDQNVEPPHRGQSFFIVERGTEGFEAVEMQHKMGFRMSSTAELFFRDVRVPGENLVGEVNKGFYQLVKLLNMTRIGFAASTLGIGQGAFDRALSYAQQREQSGRKIGEFQVIQHKLAEMATKIETAHLLVYKSAWSYDKGKITPELSSMAKWYSARMAVEVCEEAIQIFGGAGYFLENEVERFYRDARVGEIVEGTREIQKNIIARSLMK